MTLKGTPFAMIEEIKINLFSFADDKYIFRKRKIKCFIDKVKEKEINKQAKYG
jgi:hypothetical protein